MNRPKIICHMETSPDGKIMGKYLWLPQRGDSEDSFYAVLSKYDYQAQLLGRTTVDDNTTLYRKPEINEKGGCEKMRNHFYSQPPFLYFS